MRKWLLCLSLLAFIHSFCEAQDTIFFKSGTKDEVRVISFGKNKIHFALNDTLYSVNQNRINYIKYRSGKYSFAELSAKFDSANKAVNAQRKLHDSTDHRPINFNFGVGASAIESDVLGYNNNFGDGPYFITQSPAFNFIIDYSFLRQISVGVGGAMQWIKDNPSEQLQNNTVNPDELEKIVRYNFSARILYHFIRNNIVDIYAGLRLGESNWTEQIVSNTTPGVNPIVYKTTVPFSGVSSFQVLVGCMIPVYHCLGLHAELGVGTPYIAAVGVTLQIKTKK